jgi:hypothetical protein
MNRILSIVSLVAIVAIATPLALAQKPGKDRDKGKDDQGQGLPVGGRSNPKPQPLPQPKPRVLPPQPQPQPQPEPRRFNPPESPKPSGKSGNQPVDGDPRRFKPSGGDNNNGGGNPNNGGNPKGRSLQPQPGSGGDSLQPQPSGRQLPRTFGQPDQPPEVKRGGGGQLGNKPELTPPNRGEPSPRSLKGNPDPDQGGDDAARRTFTPSGKPRNGSGGGSPKKLDGVPIDPVGNQPAEPAVVRKPLGKPSGRFQPPETSGPVGGEPQTLRGGKQPAAKELSAPSGGGSGFGGKTAVQSPARLRGKNSMMVSDDEPRVKEVQAKPIRPVRPVNRVEPPQGGKVFRGKDYHHEYSHHHHSSSWAFGLGISDGSTSLAFGYAKGGHHSAFGVGYSSYPAYGCGYDPYYHPYWHCPAWYQPVYYSPVYAVAAPVYYSPVYAPVVYDPWAYNSSSFAFGYSSFGGSALSSFNFAYSTSNWSLGFGWAPAPSYVVYTPVYDPYFRSVWVPGYYEIVDERVWVDGNYDEVVSTPVVETVVDPLGNSYDSVTQPGAVDYQWKEGHWEIERRRIYREGHWENVAVF